MADSRPTAKAIHGRLKALFPRCSVGVYVTGTHTIANINAEPGDTGVWLRYQDMPKIAAAFGTEHLDFQAIAGAEMIDSCSFDGSLLNISARYT